MKITDLKLIKPEYDNDIEIFIKGDENDGDYVSETSLITLKEFKELIPIFKKIIKRKGPNWEDKEKYLTEEEQDLLWEYKPRGNSDNDIHTITEIECWFLSKKDSIRYEIEL